ncbi:4'-phosphopantetheinyl transferase superfamily protein [Streptomyces sp. NPDC006627]|uniref:4'-phosphopantetheinyl transferase family protein n=1 Tax=Streptomyces sp. NPDC006627 TaxID=3154679 RepID=UPI0033A9BAF9
MTATAWRAVEVADRTWVLSGPQDDLPAGAAPTEDDLRQARGLPRWRAEEFTAGRAVLRRLLRQVRADLVGAAVRKDRRGRPILDGHPGVGISVSHDGGTIAAAVGPGRRVGVDVQLPPEPLSEALVRRCLRGRAPQVSALPEPDRSTEFARVWTVQEACVKAEGTGLAGSPWTIDVEPGRDTGRWGPYRWVSLRRSPIPLSCAFTDLER